MRGTKTKQNTQQENRLANNKNTHTHKFQNWTRDKIENEHKAKE